MTTYNGIVVIQVKDVQASSPSDLSNAIQRVVSAVSDQVMKYNGTPKDTDITGQVSGGASGVTGGSVTVTTSGNSGSVGATVTVGPGGQPTGGSVTGTYHF